MPAEVLYRKWRPQRFADVAGQEVLTRTLINALSTGKVSHAYLFAGPRGTGKTTTARLLAKAINCERNTPDSKDRPGEPCNECSSCRAYLDGTALDLIEMDGASNRGIDDVRDLREKANYAPMFGGQAHKVYLIDEVHMLTEQAFNALLKTLEEPPPHIIFILATTDAHKVPATILSRCQRHEFRRIPLAAIADRLAFICEQEGITVPREGLEQIARAATGSLRDAINLLEQVCDSFGKDASLEHVREGLGLIADERSAWLAQQAIKGDLAGGLATIGAVRDDGLDLRQFQKEVVMRLRELLLVESGAATEAGWTPEQLAEMRKSLEGVQHDRLVRLLKLFGQADLRADPLSPLPLELALAESTIVQTVAPPRAESAPRPTPPAGTQRAVGGQRPAPPTQQRPAPSASRPQAPAPPAPRPASQDRPPAELRKSSLDPAATPEQISAMLGSKSGVIPPAGTEDPPAAVAPTTATTSSGGGFDPTLIARLRAAVRTREKVGVKLDALLNGSCDAVSFEDGVLTLGFYQDAHHKKQVEDSANRRIYEEAAAEVLGGPVTIRCTIVTRQPRTATKSALVQHAVKNGATIVSEE